MKKQLMMLGLMLAATVASAGAETDGKAVYEANCKKCHGAAGVPSAGIKKMNPKIEDLNAAFFANRTEKDLIDQINKGKDKMKSFTDKLTKEEIAAVAKYMRTLSK